MKNIAALALLAIPFAASVYAQEAVAVVPTGAIPSVPISCSSTQMLTAISGNLICVPNSGSGSGGGRYTAISGNALLDTKFGCVLSYSNLQSAAGVTSTGTQIKMDTLPDPKGMYWIPSSTNWPVCTY